MALTPDQIMALNLHDYHQMILPYLNGGGMGMKLLWENSDPTQAMASGAEINLSSNDYDLLILIPKQHKDTSDALPAVIAPKGFGFRITQTNASSSGASAFYRLVSYITDVKYTVGDCSAATGTSASAVSNNQLIPYRIYGIKIYNRDVPGKTTLLWSNPDPSSAFAAQRITLASSNYDLLCIIISQNVITTQNPHRRSISNIVQKGQGTETEIIIYYQGSVLVRSRAFDYVDDTHLDVSDNTQNGTTNNSDNIPLAVYGIKL